ncbi:MAG: hypothetical protein R3E14_07055 [Erythrobacter sp.]
MTAIRILGLVAAPLAFAATGAIAQETIAYDSGEYEYAQAPEPEVADPREAVVFQERPVVQSIPSVDPDVEIGDLPAQSEAPIVEPAPATTGSAEAPRIRYADPAIHAQPAAPGGASRVIYRRNGQDALPGYTYVYESSVPTLPAGGRVVQFDREAWLAECRHRLGPVTYYVEDGYDEVMVESEDRSGECEPYLDGYMESARTGGLHNRHSSTGEYMLVPVTVMIPQRAVYADGTPVKR